MKPLSNWRRLGNQLRPVGHAASRKWIRRLIRIAVLGTKDMAAALEYAARFDREKLERALRLFSGGGGKIADSVDSGPADAGKPPAGGADISDGGGTIREIEGEVL